MRQARILAQATSDLVNAIKADAEGETDLENSRKLLSAAKILADATAKMVEAAKVSVWGRMDAVQRYWLSAGEGMSSPWLSSSSQSKVLH